MLARLLPTNSFEVFVCLSDSDFADAIAQVEFEISVLLFDASLGDATMSRHTLRVGFSLGE